MQINGAWEFTYRADRDTGEVAVTGEPVYLTTARSSRTVAKADGYFDAADDFPAKNMV